jgi:hypothetical protein
MKKLLALVLMLGGLSACASSSMKSDVTRFHQFPAERASVAIVAADRAKAGSLEFRQTAQSVSARLAEAGFPPASAEAPHYVAQIDYFLQPVLGDADRDEGPRMSIGVGGGTGGYRSGFGMGVGTSFDLGGGRADQTALRTLTLVIERRDTGDRIFEGRVQSTGPADNFVNALPLMVDALFEGFPGTSGQTVTVETPVPSRR